MKLIDKLHMVHRFWRYRLRTEADDLQFIRTHGLVGGMALDIGANKGIYSYWLHRWKSQNGEVVAFEPQPELHNHLQDVKTAFRLDNLSIYPFALSDSPGKLALHREKAGSGSATLVAGRIQNSQEQILVEVKTLDSISGGLAPISFIKCDVEGHELRVFKGAEQTLRRSLPTLLFECNHATATQGGLFRYLESLGYEGLFVINSKVFEVSDFDRHDYYKDGIDQRNYFFVDPLRWKHLFA